MYYFIINPASRSGRGRIVWETIKKELDHLGVEYRHFLLRSAGEGTNLAATLSSSGTPCTIVVVGGDGTINEVVNGLTSFDHITFACIPTGSGNDFVRGLGLTRDPIEALHAILNPTEIRPINVGHTEFIKASADGYSGSTHSPKPADGSDKSGSSLVSRNFAVSSGIGYDAAVCWEVDRSKLKQMLNRFHSGKLVYLLTALWQLLSMERLDFDITIDNDKHMKCKKAYFAAAMNLPYEGGGFRFAPDSLPDDNQFDVLIVDGVSRFGALCLLPLALKGKHVGHKGIHIVRCSKLYLESPSALCTHTDGEVPGFTDKITFSLHDKKLSVIIR